jgi:hypothetical protein
MEIDRGPAKPRKAIYRRIFWFLVGAGVNYILIAMPYKYLTANNPTMSDWLKAAFSLGVSTCVFFPWNYFVNFRTDVRKRHAFPRFLTVVLINYTISVTLLRAFKGVEAGLSLRIGNHDLDLDVITMQLCLGWLKFLFYHKWAFPVAKETNGSPDAPDKAV